MGNIIRRLFKREEDDADYLPISSSVTTSSLPVDCITKPLPCSSSSSTSTATPRPPPCPCQDDAMVRRAITAAYAEEVKRSGNEQYNKGCFEEALRLYDCPLVLCPDSAACRANRAAALTGLRRFGEAVKDCAAALRIDPSYGRAHQRLASSHLRLGHVEDALKHLSVASIQHRGYPLELHRLQTVEKHLGRCLDARKTGEWKSVLTESDAAIAAGADSSALLLAAKAEALIQLNLLDEADSRF